MKKKKFLLIGAVLFVLVFSACTSKQKAEASDYEETTPLVTENMFTSRDLENEYDETEYNHIHLLSSTANADTSAVVIEDSVVTIPSAGNYIIDGNLTDGTIIVDVDKTEKVYLVLKNVDITSSDYAPLYIKNADKVFLFLEGENTLTSADIFAQKDENTVDGAIFSKEDLTIQGTGSLVIRSGYHGIVGKDDLKITGGSIKIEASCHGITANDSIRFTNTSIAISASKDGLHCENMEDTTKGYIYIESGEYQIKAQQDGMDASGTLQIHSGTICITSGTSATTASTKGIKAEGNIILYNGEIEVSSLDDAVHSNSSILICGGSLVLKSDDDGIHADTSLTIQGGSIEILKSYEGLEAQNVTVEAGAIKIASSDDGINAAGGNDGSSLGGRPGQNGFTSSASCYINISGGTIYINAGGDGIDSNGKLTISGGYIVVEGPTDNGNGALDYDSTALVSGGVIIAIGYSGMAMNFSSAEQGSILCNLNSVQSKNTKIVLKDTSGDILLEFTSSKSFNSILISCPELVIGESFTLTVGSQSIGISLTSFLYGGGMNGGMQPGNSGGAMRPGGRG